MLNRIICSLVAVGCFSIAGSLAADNTQALKTELSKPFKSVSIPDTWTVESNEKNGLNCIHRDNENVNFSMIKGKKSVKKTGLDLLQNQIDLYAKMKANSIPMLLQAFDLGGALRGEANDEVMERDPSEVFDSEMPVVKFGKIEWLKVNSKNLMKVTTSTSDTDASAVSETEIIMRTVNYMAIVDKHLYMVNFSAPANVFEQYAPLFETTMQSLCAKPSKK